MSRRTLITVTDMFCGAGGSSTGAKSAGAEVRMAMNHWALAVDTHNTNHPEAAHDCADISQVNPKRYGATDILIASPECTNHSLASGKKRKNLTQGNLFDTAVIDPSEERSRATMWDVCRFAETHAYRAVIVENVVDAMRWQMFPAWLQAMQLLGFKHEIVFMNSMHVHPTPQSRDRMYVVFWRGIKRPDLAVRPRAYCPRCTHEVQAVQVWKPGKKWGVYSAMGSKRGQYAFNCPDCNRQVEPFYHAAYNAIDWSLPITRISDRVRPLKDTTIARIQAGLDKFSRPDTGILSMRGPWAIDGTEKPLTVVMASCVQHFLLQPFLMETKFTHAAGARAKPVTAPMATQTAQQTRALVMPFVTSQYGTGGNTAIDDAMPTVPGAQVHGVVVPWILSGYTRHSGQQVAASSIDAAMPTQPGRAVHSLIAPPYLVNMHSNSQPTAMNEPLATMLTGNHKWLVDPGTTVRVEDCGFRMLEPHECQAAMAFPADYIVKGDKRQRIKQLGNAVTPPAMHHLMTRCMEAFSR